MAVLDLIFDLKQLLFMHNTCMFEYFADTNAVSLTKYIEVKLYTNHSQKSSLSEKV